MKYLATVKSNGERRTDRFDTLRELNQHLALCKHQGWKILKVQPFREVVR